MGMHQIYVLSLFLLIFVVQVVNELPIELEVSEMLYGDELSLDELYILGDL